MQAHKQNLGSRRHGDFPLPRRLVLRVRCARPGATAGQNQVITQLENLARNGLKCWQRAARFRRTLVVVKRRTLCPIREPRERKRRDSHRGQVDKFRRKTE